MSAKVIPLFQTASPKSELETFLDQEDDSALTDDMTYWRMHYDKARQEYLDEKRSTNLIILMLMLPVAGLVLATLTVVFQ